MVKWESLFPRQSAQALPLMWTQNLPPRMCQPLDCIIEVEIEEMLHSYSQKSCKLWKQLHVFDFFPNVFKSMLQTVPRIVTISSQSELFMIYGIINQWEVLLNIIKFSACQN